MQTIKASVFKAQCLQLMNHVNETNEEIVITKNGKPISKLVPYRQQAETLYGLHKDSIKSEDDLIAPTGEKWHADI